MVGCIHTMLAPLEATANAHSFCFSPGKPLNRVDSIITADDANHSRQRKLLSHSFADKTLKVIRAQAARSCFT